MRQSILRVGLVLVILLAAVGVARASSFNVQLNGPTGDLSQGGYYVWGFNPGSYSLNGEEIYSFQFTYKNLAEVSWDNNNYLKTDLLNSTYPTRNYGVYSSSEPTSSQYLMFWGFGGVTATAHDYSSPVITDTALVNLLKAQWLTTWVGIGMDPDCHFVDTNIILTVNTRVPTSNVPEPASLLLLGTGLVGLGRAWRKRRA